MRKKNRFTVFYINHQIYNFSNYKEKIYGPMNEYSFCFYRTLIHNTWNINTNFMKPKRELMKPEY